ncbi:MAG: hypothetical protein KGL18_08420, partial [Burkholderiales bacterium]|nr:hypothetical protein [Burkholderiales bacterium]
DGRPPLDLPPGWTVQADHVGTLWSSGTCDAASVLLQPASGTRRWRISIARQTCAVTSSELAQASP